MYSVYLHINTINGKVYVGKCNHKPSYRWGVNGQGYLRCSQGHEKADQRHFASAIRKYGWDSFKHVVLFNDCLTAEEASQKERELINYYNSNNPAFGYNMTSGGEGCPDHPVEEETRALIADSLTKYRHIRQYDKKGNFIKEWDNVAEILAQFNMKSDSNFYSHLNGRQKSFNGYVFKLEGDTEEINYETKTTSKKVRCYSLDGKYIKTYCSGRDAAKDKGVFPSEITQCIKGKRHQAGGYVWKEDIGDYNDIITRSKYSKLCKPVIQIDFDGNIVAEYSSVKDAFIKTGIYSISAVCRGLVNSAGGYMWKFKNDTSEIKPYVRIQLKGEQHWNYGKTGEKSASARKVCQYSLAGEFIKEWECIIDAAKSLGLASGGHIGQCCRGKRNSAGGYMWKYKEE